MSETEGKRRNESSISLLNLKSLMTQNIVPNNNFIEYKSLSIEEEETDEIENKRRKISQTFLNSNGPTEYLTTPDFKSLSNSTEQSTNQTPLQRFVIPRVSTAKKNQLNYDTRIIIAKDEQESSLISPSSNWKAFHISLRLRNAMINISKRLKFLSIVDTHCHFDLIFDRLCIQHNDIRKYFDDYKDLYPSNLSFELAIHVFWRPEHLTEKNWINWYSNYLNDERIYGSCGIHPHWSSSWSETIIEDIERCLKHPKIIAIGEIGLDFGPKNTCDTDQQCQVFIEQLKLAKKWLKPVVIHSRNAYQQTFDIMKQYLEPNHKIHLHCFVGTIDDIHLFTSYFTEIKFGFTPTITRTKIYHSVIQQLDLTQILTETDSPYFVPKELANLTRCAHPSMVYSVIESIAFIQQISINHVAYQLRENVYQIYGV